MKKGTFALVIACFIAVLAFVEFKAPIASAATTYTVSIQSEGEPVTKPAFKGYQFTETAYTKDGKEVTLEFLSDKPLQKNCSYKIVVQDNKMVLRATELQSNTHVVSNN
ncbi:YxeA family protein [Listeria costaricensis]|uniref:YxeA family protein n=1 Tax=Listeria costaricensis TaxID=2026604 RepID=UPI000C078509|nr:YxeA family protein [Listeria costaricensis]